MSERTATTAVGMTRGSIGQASFRWFDLRLPAIWYESGTDGTGVTTPERLNAGNLQRSRRSGWGVAAFKHKTQATLAARECSADSGDFITQQAINTCIEELPVLNEVTS